MAATGDRKSAVNNSEPGEPLASQQMKPGQAVRSLNDVESLGCGGNPIGIRVVVAAAKATFIAVIKILLAFVIVRLKKKEYIWIQFRP